MWLVNFAIYESSEVLFIEYIINDEEAAKLSVICFVKRYDRRNPDVFSNCLFIDDISELKRAIKRIDNPRIPWRKK